MSGAFVAAKAGKVMKLAAEKSIFINVEIESLTWIELKDSGPDFVCRVGDFGWQVSQNVKLRFDLELLIFQKS